MSQLALDSLLIEDFRAFKRLEIERLGRVNLIVGKNNVGKTALLEALRLYASQGAEEAFAALILRRDEDEFLAARQRAQSGIAWADAIWTLRHGRQTSEDVDRDGQRGLFRIGALNEGDKQLTFRFGRRPSLGDTITVGSGFKEAMRLVSLKRSLSDHASLGPTQPARRHYYYVPSVGLSPDETSLLWDEAVLAGRDERVLEALRVIDRAVKYVNFVTGSRPIPTRRRERAEFESVRVPVCRRSTDTAPVPLRSMGEGMDRLLNLGLALVNASEGTLLVDEIENGLHYSVQPDVWRLLFTTAAEFDVQVFATTHSLDCIRAFQAAAEEHPEEGRLVSLRRHQEPPHDIVAVEFDERDMASIVRSNVEVR